MVLKYSYKLVQLKKNRLTVQEKTWKYTLQ